MHRRQLMPLRARVPCTAVGLRQEQGRPTTRAESLAATAATATLQPSHQAARWPPGAITL